MLRKKAKSPAAVLYVANSARFGGSNARIMTIASNLDRRRYLPHVALPGTGEMENRLAGQDIPQTVVANCWPSKRNPIGYLRSCWRSASLSRTLCPAIIHGNSLECLFPFKPVIRRRSRPKVVVHLGYRIELPSGRWAAKHAPRPDVFICCSNRLREEVEGTIREVYGQVRLEAWHNPVDTKVMAPSCDRDAKRKELGLSAAHVAIGIVANLTPCKGHETFFRMAALLAESHPDVRLFIVGEDILHDGVYKEQLRQLVVELQLADVTRFLGWQDSVPAILAAMDVVVSASKEEYFGISILEAMACARPVVVPRVGGLPEFVINGECGFVVEPNSAEALASATRKLVESAELRKEFGRAGRERVIRGFSETRYCDRLMALYDDLRIAGCPP